MASFPCPLAAPPASASASVLLGSAGGGSAFLPWASGGALLEDVARDSSSASLSCVTADGQSVPENVYLVLLTQLQGSEMKRLRLERQYKEGLERGKDRETELEELCRVFNIGIGLQDQLLCSTSGATSLEKWLEAKDSKVVSLRQSLISQRLHNAELILSALDQSIDPSPRCKAECERLESGKMVQLSRRLLDNLTLEVENLSSISRELLSKRLDIIAYNGPPELRKCLINAKERSGEEDERCSRISAVDGEIQLLREATAELDLQLREDTSPDPEVERERQRLTTEIIEYKGRAREIKELVWALNDKIKHSQLYLGADPAESQTLVRDTETKVKMDKVLEQAGRKIKEMGSNPHTLSFKERQLMDELETQYKRIIQLTHVIASSPRATIMAKRQEAAIWLVELSCLLSRWVEVCGE